MQLLINVFKHRKLILKMGLSDFKNKFSSTSLGMFWGFIQPIILMFMYYLVFTYLLPSQAPNNAIPFSAWFLPGMAMWMFLSDSTLSISQSIRSYSYLVKKMVFPIDMIPFISFISNFIVAIILFSIVTITSAFVGVIPNFLTMFYAIFCAICFIIASTRLFSALSTLVPDFSRFLETLMQILFWVTPVIWQIGVTKMPPVLEMIAKFNPFTYPVMVIRDAFLGVHSTMFAYQENFNYMYTIAFWVITLVFYIYGGYVFNKNKKDFADVL